MANALLKLGLPFAIVAFLYQAFLSDLLFVVLGIGRHVQHIEEFPYRCHRIEDPRLAACEDMWLSDATRQLFLACSDPLSRQQWMPNVARFNVSGRSLTDGIIALDIDKPTTSGDNPAFSYRVLKTPDFPNVNSPAAGDYSTLHLVGLTGVDSPEQVHLYLVNAKPSIDAITGEFADNSLTGANSTIEHFITGPAATAMKHIQTYHHPGIATPNNIATASGMKGFYITNDHGSSKTGRAHSLSQVLGTGDVTYCDTASPSSIVCIKLAGGLKFPNGLLFHPVHNLLYVPSAAVGNIHVYEPTYSPGSRMPKLKKVAVIKIPYPIDNLSLDPHTGNIYAAAFPKASEVMKGFDEPIGFSAPSAAIRVRKVEGRMKWEWEKVVEDRDGEVLPVSTTVVKDGRTGRLFFSVPLGAVIASLRGRRYLRPAPAAEA